MVSRSQSNPRLRMMNFSRAVFLSLRLPCTLNTRITASTCRTTSSAGMNSWRTLASVGSGPRPPADVVDGGRDTVVRAAAKRYFELARQVVGQFTVQKGKRQAARVGLDFE